MPSFSVGENLTLHLNKVHLLKHCIFCKKKTTKKKQKQYLPYRKKKIDHTDYWYEKGSHKTSPDAISGERGS